MNNILENLNERQIEAVKSIDGSFLVLAGAGSGKTKVVTHRIAYLIKNGVLPESILALTFTNKAAKEMQDRINILLSESYGRLKVSTFHSFGSTVLRKYAEFFNRKKHFTIADSADQIRVVKRVLKRLNLKDVLVKKEKMILSNISFIKNNFLKDDSITEKINNLYLKPFMLKIYQAYESLLEEINSFDFDDLIVKTARLFDENMEIRYTYLDKIDYLMIDEFQDTNAAQLILIKLLYKGNIFVVGDEDQSIYKWRGADVRNILEFSKKFENTKIIDLKYNYRSTKNIVETAKCVISHNKNRYDKEILANSGEGENVNLKIVVDDRNAVDFIITKVKELKEKLNLRYSDFAILYRINALSRPLERYLKGIIPYRIIGSLEFYQRKEIKDIISYFKVLINNSDIVSFERVVSNLYNGIGKKSIEKFELVFLEHNSVIEALEKFINLGTVKGKILSVFKKIYDDLINYSEILATSNLYDFIEYFLDNFSYINMFRADAKYNEESQDRLDNINEFVNEIIEYNQDNPNNQLYNFMEEVSLQSQKKSQGDDMLNLLSLHSSKGLEFSVVFIFGFENRIVPLIRYGEENSDDMEEERRLLYVGLTRAKTNLYLIERERSGSGQELESSSFFYDLKKSSYFEVIGNNKIKSVEKYMKKVSPRSVYGEYKVGKRVVHSLFGMGTIKKLSNPSDPIALIDFVNYPMPKKLKINLSNLSLM